MDAIVLLLNSGSSPSGSMVKTLENSLKDVSFLQINVFNAVFVVCRRVVLLILLISVYFSRGTRRTSAMKQPWVRCLFQTASLLDGLVFSPCISYFCICCFMILCSFALLLFTKALCVGDPFHELIFETSMLTKTLPFNFPEWCASFDDVGTNFSRCVGFALKMFHLIHTRQHFYFQFCLLKVSNHQPVVCLVELVFCRRL